LASEKARGYELSYMVLRRVVALALGLLGTFATERAYAWQEAHEVGDDVAIHVESDGVATVQHHFRWHVVHGPLRSIDIVGFEVPATAVDPSVEVTGDDGRTLTARAGPIEDRRETKRDEARDPAWDERTVHVEVDEPKAFMRGTFTFQVHYRVDWVASHALAVDGPAWRLTWSGPLAADGFDSARVTFELPAAPEEPRAILAETGALDDSAVASLRRDPTRDTLELLRPHVAKGEPVTWALRLDPRALRSVVDPRLRPPARAKLPEEPNRIVGASLAAALLALALAFGLLVLHKTRAFAARCAEYGGHVRGLIPLPPWARALLGGLALAAGVGLQALDPGDGSAAGAALVALAALAAAVRPGPMTRPPRGPGRWLVLRPDDAFARSPGAAHWLDLDTAAGRACAVAAATGLAALVAATALASHAADPRLPWLVAMDAVAFAPLLLTGRGAALPPDGARAHAPWLARVFRRLRLDATLRVAPWLRSVAATAPVAGDAPPVGGDELRLLVLPRAATPGLVGIEVGLAWNPTLVGWAANPEVLVRVLERSPAAARFGVAAPMVRTTFGRHADERVATLRPRASDARGTTSLIRHLAEALRDRRLETKAHATERRAPANLVRPAPAEARTAAAARGGRDAVASPASPSC
jgi:hypothetical protein